MPPTDDILSSSVDSVINVNLPTESIHFGNFIRVQWEKGYFKISKDSMILSNNNNNQNDVKITFIPENIDSLLFCEEDRVLYLRLTENFKAEIENCFSMLKNKSISLIRIKFLHSIVKRHHLQHFVGIIGSTNLELSLKTSLELAPYNSAVPCKLFYSPIENNETHETPAKIQKTCESVEEQNHCIVLSDDDEDEQPKQEINTNSANKNLENPFVTENVMDRKNKNAFHLNYSGVVITSEDLDVLKPEVFFNDKIINFYLRYIWREVISESVASQYHFFNSFIYTKLTKAFEIVIVNNQKEPNPTFDTSSLSECKVFNMPKYKDFDQMTKTEKDKIFKQMSPWTKKINMFDKDFMIIPINENYHWYVALVCFPWMAGMISYLDLFNNGISDKFLLTGRFKDIEEKLVKGPLITNQDLEDALKPLPDDKIGDAFNRWRRLKVAKLMQNGVRPMPCLLIFDSLPYARRVSALKLVRDYLQIEWDNRKAPLHGNIRFDRDTLRGYGPKVPRQGNLYDCGAFLLHYVEKFVKEPILEFTKDYFQMQMNNWFSQESIIEKRKSLLTLLLDLESKNRRENTKKT